MRDQLDQLVGGTLEVYKQALASLLPTPTKSHYLFNLRDFGRVVQGITLASKSQIGEDKDKMTRLWVHEMMRVFYDRLVDDEDRGWFVRLIRDVVKKTTGRSFDDVFRHLDNNGDGKVDSLEEVRGLLFGDYMAEGGLSRWCVAR